MDVRRLDISMTNAFLMQVEHDLNELLAERAAIRFFQAVLGLDDVGQAWPGQELQDQICTDQIQRGHDASVLTKADQIELLFGSRQNLLVHIAASLDCNEPSRLFLNCAVDTATAPSAYLLHLDVAGLKHCIVAFVTDGLNQ